MAQRWDVFVSYAHEDEAWVRVLAENLHRAGREVFFDRWEVVGGSLLAQRLQERPAGSNMVVPVVSRAAVGKEWWQESSPRPWRGVMAGAQWLVTVLRDDMPLPPFVAGRVYVDFRHLDAPAQDEARFAELLRAVQGCPQIDRPPRGGGVVGTTNGVSAGGTASRPVAHRPPAGGVQHRRSGTDASATGEAQRLAELGV